MTTFDNREKAAESKFAHDAEIEFRAEARRNKLLGLWAAEQLGKSGTEAEAYAKSVIAADLHEAGEEDVFRKLRADLDPGKVSDHVIRRQMEELRARAIAEIRSGS